MPQDTPIVRTRTLVRWGMIGQLGYLTSQLVTLVGLTRLATVEDVGSFGLASAIVVPVFFFFGLNMQVNVASGQQVGVSFRDFRALLGIFALAGYLLIVLIAVAAFSGQTLALLLVIGLAKAAESFSQMAYGVFQRNDRMALVAGSLVLRGVLSAVVFLLTLWQSGQVVAAFAAQMAVWGLIAGAVDMRLARRLSDATGDSAPANRGRVRTLARSSLYLAFSGLLSALQGNMPRYVIASALGVAALGYFTVIGYAMQSVATLVGAVTQSLVARLTHYMSVGHGHALLATLLKLLAGLGLFLLAGVGGSLWIGGWLIETVFGPDFAGLGSLLAAGIAAAALQGVVLTLQSFLLSARAFRQIVVIRIGTVLAMLVGCSAGALLADIHGVIWGMCAAYIVHIVAMAVPVRRIILRHMAH